MQSHTAHHDRFVYALLPGLRHWSPMVLVSLVVNVGLFVAFAWLVAKNASESSVGENSRLTVRLVSHAPERHDLSAGDEKFSVNADTVVPAQKTAANTTVEKADNPTAPHQAKRTAQTANTVKKVKAVKIPEPQPLKTTQSSIAAVATMMVKKAAKIAPSQIPSSTVTVNKQTDELAMEQGPVIPPPQMITSTNVVPLSRLTRMPKLLSYDEEAFERYYPPKEREIGKEATVEAMILVDAEGVVQEVEITKSAGPDFDAAAKEIILSKVLTIEPGYIGNQPVASRLPIPIVFHLID